MDDGEEDSKDTIAEYQLFPRAQNRVTSRGSSTSNVINDPHSA